MRQRLLLGKCRHPEYSLLLMVPVLLATITSARADDPPAKPGLDAYLRDIGMANTELNAGRIPAAKKLLDATDKSHWSFEFSYLKARAEKSEGDGKPAPDLIRTLEKPQVEYRYGVLNEVSRQVVYICRDGGLRIYDLAEPEVPPRPVRHPRESPMWSGAFSRDGKSFFTGHENGEVVVWDASKWEIRHIVPVGKESAVRELAANFDGSAFVAEGQKDLELWSLAGKEPTKVAAVGERYNFGEGLAFSPKGDLLATGGMFDIILHDAKTGKPLGSKRHASYTMGLEFSPDGTRIASAPRGNVNRFLAVFDVKREDPLFNAGPFGHYVAGLAFTPDGTRIAATGCEKLMRIFDAATGQVVLSFHRKECSAKPYFSRDGRVLGWNEPEGFMYIDLGKSPDGQKQNDQN